MKFADGEIVCIWPTEYKEPVYGVIVSKIQYDEYEILADEKLWKVNYKFISKQISRTIQIPFNLGAELAKYIQIEIDNEILKELQVLSDNTKKELK